MPELVCSAIRRLKTRDSAVLLQFVLFFVYTRLVNGCPPVEIARRWINTTFFAILTHLNVVNQGRRIKVHGVWVKATDGTVLSWLVGRFRVQNRPTGGVTQGDSVRRIRDAVPRLGTILERTDTKQSHGLFWYGHTFFFNFENVSKNVSVFKIRRVKQGCGILVVLTNPPRVAGHRRVHLAEHVRLYDNP